MIGGGNGWRKKLTVTSERLGDFIRNVCNVCNFLLVHAVCQERIKDAKCHQMPWFASKNLQIFVGEAPQTPPQRQGRHPPLVLSPRAPSARLWAFGSPFQLFLTSSSHIPVVIKDSKPCFLHSTNLIVSVEHCGVLSQVGRQAAEAGCLLKHL